MSTVIDLSGAISTDIDAARYKGKSWSSDQMQQLFDQSKNHKRRKRRILPGDKIDKPPLSPDNPCL